MASADEWRAVLEPVVARYRDLDIRKYFRGDAAFALAYNLGNFLMTGQARQSGLCCDALPGMPCADGNE